MSLYWRLTEFHLKKLMLSLYEVKGVPDIKPNRKIRDCKTNIFV